MYVLRGIFELFLFIVFIFLYVVFILFRFWGFIKWIDVLIILLKGLLFFVIMELFGNDMWVKGVWLLFESVIVWLRFVLNRIGLGLSGIIIFIGILLFLIILMVVMVFMNLFLILFFIFKIIFLILLEVVRLKNLFLFVFLVSLFLI